MDTDGEQAQANIDARLAAVPAALAAWRTTLSRAAERRPGRGPAAGAGGRRAGPRLGGCRPGGGGDDVFGNLVARAGCHRHAARQPRPARGRGPRRADRDSGLPRVRARAAGPRRRRGRARGVRAASRATSSAPTIDLDETYAWGWAELHRIHEEKLATADQIVPGGSIADAVGALDDDPDRWIDGGAAFRDWMQDEADAALADLADVHFDIPEPVRRIECRLAPTHDGGIYYTGPSEDFSRPGRMWWSVPDGVDRFSPWRELTDRLPRGGARPSPPDRPDGVPLRPAQPVAAAAVLGVRPRRGLGAVRRAADGRARLPRRPGRPARHARQPGVPRGAGGRRHRHAPAAADPGGQPVRLPPGRAVDAGADARADARALPARRRDAAASSGTATSAGPARRRRTRSASGSGCRRGTTPGRGWARRSTCAAFHRAALDLGSLGLDPLREALARL